MFAPKDRSGMNNKNAKNAVASSNNSTPAGTPTAMTKTDSKGSNSEKVVYKAK